MTEPQQFLDFIKEIKSTIHTSPEQVGKPIHYKLKTHKRKTAAVLISPNKRLVNFIAKRFCCLEEPIQTSDHETGQIVYKAQIDFKIAK